MHLHHDAVGLGAEAGLLTTIVHTAISDHDNPRSGSRIIFGWGQARAMSNGSEGRCIVLILMGRGRNHTHKGNWFGYHPDTDFGVGWKGWKGSRSRCSASPSVHACNRKINPQKGTARIAQCSQGTCPGVGSAGPPTTRAGTDDGGSTDTTAGIWGA